MKELKLKLRASTALATIEQKTTPIGRQRFDSHFVAEQLLVALGFKLPSGMTAVPRERYQ